ncbi:glycosyltransferase family 4 protein [Microbacterium sp. HA-8]|uniref:glycosyltransferase family 4 protein n=1 Tax=unclassified Microbacterium TaxID=2609290 RepID=UPI0025FD763D|nr:glycosyltransferase family 4 protein [Microbacterium sp.]
MCASETYGGAELYLQRAADALVRRGHEVVLIGRVPGFEGARIDVGLGDKWSRRTLPWAWIQLPAERRRVLSAVRAVRPDVIHLQFKREQIGMTRALSRFAPVVWTEHGRMERGVAQIVLGMAYRRAASHVRAISAVAAGVADDVIARTGRTNGLSVLENGVDTTRMDVPSARRRAEARRQLGIDDDRPVAVWVGRMHPAKRPGLAVDIARDWWGHVVMAGSGVALPALEVSARTIPSVTILGHVEELSAVYSAADVLLVTSASAAREGLPTTILEAAAFGVPTLASRDAGVDDGVLAAGGRLVESGADAARWRTELDELVASSSSGRPRAWAEAHSLPVWEDAICRFFEAAGYEKGASR